MFKNTFQNVTAAHRYIGDKIKGQKTGFGVQIWQEGQRYHGIFSGNKANGLGTFYLKEGDVYQGEIFINEGEFISDKAHGFGFYKHQQASYTGEWKDDSQNGLGILCMSYP